MNIAFFFFVPFYEHIGGVQRVTAILAREFQSRGYGVYFVTLMSEKEKIEYLNLLHKQNQETEGYIFAAPQYYIDTGQDLKVVLKDTWTFLQEKDIHFVIHQDINECTLPILKSISLRIPTVIVNHHMPFEFYKREKFIYKRLYSDSWYIQLWFRFCTLFPMIVRYKNVKKTRKLYSSVLKSANRLCLLSECFVDRLKILAPNVDLSKVVAINNPNSFEPTFVDYNTKENLVIMVCRMEDNIKNVSDFLKSWKVIEKRGVNWNAEVVGDGSDLDYLKELAKLYNLKKLTFKGYQKDVSTYYRRAKILCVCSWHEGWGMTIPESMAFGCVPISYSTYDSVKELIIDGWNGVLIESNTPDELSIKMMSLMGNEDIIRRLSDNALQYVGKFSAKVIANKWISLYNDIKCNTGSQNC